MPNLASPILDRPYQTMPSLASPVFDRDEISFKRMWEEAQIRFKERTSKSLRSSAGKSLEDVFKELEEKYPQESIFDPQGESKSKAKDVVRNVLNCINILGGIVAQGASMAFGGAADICYSAVSFLIEMHARIDRLYEGLAQLFEEISTFLKTFKIYKRIESFREVDPELKRITGRLMVSFVDICALSIKLLSGSKWKKFKTVLKVAVLDDDSGIREELDKFKGLIDQSSRISDAVTLEAVMESHDEVVRMLKDASRTSGQQLLYLEGISSGVNIIKANVDEGNLQKIHTANIEKLLKKLSINSETVKASVKSLEDIRVSPVPQSGLWIKSFDEYKRWISPSPESSEANSLLLLYGGERSGKSFLIGGIIEELEFQYRKGQKGGTVAYIAYYCFSRADKKMEKSSQIKNPHLPTTALKSMAMQIAESDNISYSKEMAAFWETKTPTDCDDMSCRELWEALQLPAPKKETVHYLVFDGLEVLTDSYACELFDVLLSAKHPRVRILVSAVRDVLDVALQPIRDRLIDDSMPQIDVDLNNGADIRMFIERYLSQNDDLFGQDPGTEELKAWVKENLPEVVKGNFSRLQTALDQLTDDYKRSLSVGDIIQNLKKGDFSQDPKDVISRLNKSLNNQEIDRLNEMLIWTIYGLSYLHVDELRAALFLRFKSESAQPLTIQLTKKGKYELLFAFGQDQRVVTKDEFRDFLTENARSPRSKGGVGGKDRPHISMTIKIADADVETVQRFFWDLGGRALFDPFTFDNMEGKGEVRKKIYLHEVEAILAMTLQCLEVLLAEPNEATAAMVPYALKYLPQHLTRLKEFADSGEIVASEKYTVVDKLVNLLSDTECIERHWNRDYNEFSQELAIFTSWLSDMNAVESLRPRDRRWLERLVSNTNSKTTCLEDIASMVAEHWLRRRDWENVMDCVRWIQDYIQQVSQPQADQDGETKKETEDDAGGSVKSDPDLDDRDNLMTIAKILQAAAWVEEELRIKNKDSIWFERLGQTFLTLGFGEEALEAYRKSKEFPDVHRRSIRGLARAYAWIHDDLQSAINEITPVVEALRTRKDIQGLEKDERSDLVDCLRDLADWHLQRQDPGSSVGISLLQEVLELDPGNHASRWDLYRSLVKTNCSEQAFELLKNFPTLPNKKVGTLDRLAEMILSVADGPNYANNVETFDLILSMTAGDPMSKSILENLKACIDFAHKENKPTVVMQMQFFEGSALFRYKVEEEHQKDAVAAWKRSCSTGFAGVVDDWSLTLCLSQVVRRLSLYYHSAAKKIGGEINEHVIELQELYKQAQKEYWISQPVFTTLAAYYVSTNAASKAKELLAREMKTGLDLLSDDDPDNDWIGYLQIAQTALHSGDDLTSLSAWSLLVPDDVDDEPKQGQQNGVSENGVSENVTSAPAAAPRTGKLWNNCDGRCGKRWSYADDMWCCKICNDCQFDTGCLEKLRNGTLTRVICHPDHEWLYVPPFSDEEYREVGKGRVRMGGTLVNGKREGGTTVPIAEWLDALRDDWGIPREEKSAEKSE